MGLMRASLRVFTWLPMTFLPSGFAAPSAVRFVVRFVTLLAATSLPLAAG